MQLILVHAGRSNPVRSLHLSILCLRYECDKLSATDLHFPIKEVSANSHLVISCTHHHRQCIALQCQGSKRPV